MPQPPEEKRLSSVVVQMQQLLLDEIKLAMKTAQEQALEQQRTLNDTLVARIFSQSDDSPVVNDALQVAELAEVMSPQIVIDTVKPPSSQEQVVVQVAQNGSAPTLEICALSPENGGPEETDKESPNDQPAQTTRGQTLILENAASPGDEQYSERNLLYQTGICVTIVNSIPFHALSFTMILANACYLGIEADWNKAQKAEDADFGYQFCDQMFCSFFVIELTVRLFTFRRKLDCFKDNWFLLDFVMVVLMVIETWVFLLFSGNSYESGVVGGLGRTLRLLRLTRISRLMKLIPELVTMAKGMVAAIRAVHAALIILVLLVYVFAILMNSLLGSESESFPTVRDSMVTLVVQGVFLDNLSTLTRELIDVGSFAALLCLTVFILLSTLTVMNMLIGVLCQVVLEVSAEEKENQVKKHMRENLLVMLEDLDEDNSGELSKVELQKLLCHPDCAAIMLDIQVDTQHLLDLTDMLYASPDTTISISVIMNIVLSLRGKRPVCMNDFAKANNFLMWALETQLARNRELMAEVIHGGKLSHADHSTKMDELLQSMKEHQQTIKDHQDSLHAHLKVTVPTSSN